MVFSNESSSTVYTSADFFLAELTSQYSVSEKFLERFIPRVEKIFEHNISDEQRQSLLQLARESIVRQAETEALLKEASAVLDQLKTTPQAATSRTRRQRPVSSTLDQDETSPAITISSAS